MSSLSTCLLPSWAPVVQGQALCLPGGLLALHRPLEGHQLKGVLPGVGFLQGALREGPQPLQPPTRQPESSLPSRAGIPGQVHARPLQLSDSRGWLCSSKTSPRVTLPNLILAYSKVLPQTHRQGERPDAGCCFCAEGRRICHSFQVKLLHNPMISSGPSAPRRRWQSCGHGSAQAPASERCESAGMRASSPGPASRPPYGKYTG